MPATLATAWISPPTSGRWADTAASTASRSRTSTATGTSRRPSGPEPSIWTRARSRARTVQPWARKRSAVLRPMPLPAPVTTATNAVIGRSALRRRGDQDEPRGRPSTSVEARRISVHGETARLAIGWPSGRDGLRRPAVDASTSSITLQQLRYFLAAVEHGSLSAAAEAHFIAKPSLSEQVRRLEQQLGVGLFVRTNRKLILTDAARTLIPYAERAITAVEQLAAVVDPVRNLTGGSVAFGTFSSAHHL